MLPLWVLTIVDQSLSRLSQIGHLPPAVQIEAGGSIDVNDGGDPHGGGVARVYEDSLNVDQLLYIFESLPFPDTATASGSSNVKRLSISRASRTYTSNVPSIPCFH